MMNLFLNIKKMSKKTSAIFFIEIDSQYNEEGDLEALDVDFSSVDLEINQTDDKGKEVSVKLTGDEYLDLKSKVHLPKSDIKGSKVTQIRDITTGRFLNKSDSAIVQNVSDRLGISTKEAQERINDEGLIESVQDSVMQFDLINEIEGAVEENPDVIINIRTHDGTPITFKGSDVFDKDGVDLLNRELNRIYKATERFDEND